MLADHFDSVTVVERDHLTDSAEHRRGVPQARHLHGFLMRGSQVLDELFPGILDELVAAGAQHFDGTDLSRMYLNMNGHLLVRSGDAEQLAIYGPSRPFLESHIRRRVGSLANVTLLDAHDVIDADVDAVPRPRDAECALFPTTAATKPSCGQISSSTRQDAARARRRFSNGSATPGRSKRR